MKTDVIEDILKPVKDKGIPVKHMFYTGQKDPYITYQFYNEYGEAFSENREIATMYSVQVDIFTRGEVEDLYKEILDLMVSAGWFRIYAMDLYEPDTKLLHKAARFQFAEECP